MVAERTGGDCLVYGQHGQRAGLLHGTIVTGEPQGWATIQATTRRTRHMRMIIFVAMALGLQCGAEAQLADSNRAAGEAFLAENAQREGVVTLPSGLQYEVIEEGDGATPGRRSTVVVHYSGTLIDGTPFDSSLQRGEPARFPVNRVIPGWTEALRLMQVGDKWRLFIPADLAYGDRGVGPVIAPGSTLIFEVELLEVR